MVIHVQKHEYIPRRMTITREHIEHIKDPIKKAIAEEYVKKGYWTLIN